MSEKAKLSIISIGCGIDYFIDDNKNMWCCDTYSMYEAYEAMETMENCKHCIDCKWCKDCEWCIRCIDCENCTNSRILYYCWGCKECEELSFCQDYVKNKKGTSGKHIFLDSQEGEKVKSAVATIMAIVSIEKWLARNKVYGVGVRISKA